MPMGRQSTVTARKQHPLSVWSSHKAKHPQIHWRRGQGKFTQQRRFTLCCVCVISLLYSVQNWQKVVVLSVFQFPLKWRPCTWGPLYDWAMEHTPSLFMRRSTLLLAALHSVGPLSPQIHAWDARPVYFDFSRPPSFNSYVTQLSKNSCLSFYLDLVVFEGTNRWLSQCIYLNT